MATTISDRRFFFTIAALALLSDIIVAVALVVTTVRDVQTKTIYRLPVACDLPLVMQDLAALDRVYTLSITGHPGLARAEIAEHYGALGTHECGLGKYK